MNKNKILLGSTLASILFVTACNNEKGEAVNEDGEIIVELGRQVSQSTGRIPEGDTFEDNAYTRIIEEELGVDIRNSFEASDDEYGRQVSLAIASGDLPDMMVVSRDELEELIENDLIEDLTDIYEEYASSNIKEIYSSYDDAPLNDARFDDRIMGIPSTHLDRGPGFFWIRQDWIDDLNINFDSDEDGLITLSELEELARSFIENDPGNSGNPVGLALNYSLTADSYGGATYTGLPIMHAFNAYPKYYLSDENDQVYYGSNTQETKEVLGILNEWYTEGLIDHQFGTRTWDDINAMIINGETGIITGPWHLPGWNFIQFKQSNPNADLSPYVLKNEHDENKVNSLFSTGAGSYIVVRKGFSRPEVAMEIVNLIYDTLPNHADLESEYPEIVEYRRLDVDGTARPFNIEIFGAYSELEESVEIAKAVDGEIEVENLSNVFIQQTARNIIDYIEDPENSEVSSWANYNAFYLARAKMKAGLRDDNIITEITPPNFGIVNTLNQYSAQMNTLEEETFIQFITGEESLDEFDTYVENWESRGGAQVLEEMQSILDEDDIQ